MATIPGTPLTVTLYDKAFNRVGWIGDPQSVTVNLRHNQQPTGQITVRSDHHMAGRLLTEGCRVVIHYGDQQVMSGVLDQFDGSGDVDGFLQVQVRDDWSFLTDTLGWPVPTSPITDQTAAAYDTQTGPAETVVKGFASRAATRLGLPLTVAPDLARGQAITVAMRFHPLADRLFPAIEQAGIGVTVYQSGAGLRLDCYEPAWYPIVLTPGSGIVTAFQWAKKAPTFTRVAAGGQGELTARVFRSYVDSTAEALWGLKREAFVDATDVTTVAALTARAQQNAVAAAATVGLKLTLAETDTFRYGDSLRVGDLVTTQLVPGAEPITDVLREAVINWNVSDGLTVAPVVGDRDDDTSRLLGRAITSVARRFSNYVAGR